MRNVLMGFLLLLRAGPAQFVLLKDGSPYPIRYSAMISEHFVVPILLSVRKIASLGSIWVCSIGR